MAKKKSLGHNPLSYSMLGKSNFEFIRSTDPNRDDNGNSDNDSVGNDNSDSNGHRGDVV